MDHPIGGHLNLRKDSSLKLRIRIVRATIVKDCCDILLFMGLKPVSFDHYLLEIYLGLVRVD